MRSRVTTAASTLGGEVLILKLLSNENERSLDPCPASTFSFAGSNITQSGLITAIAFVAKMNVLTWKSVMQAGVVRPGFTEALPTSAVRIVIASNRATTAAIQRLLSFKFDEVQSRKYVAMPGFVQIAKNIP